MTAVSYLTGCEAWLVGNNNMPWGEIFNVLYLGKIFMVNLELKQRKW